jgi:hypothetical protein
VHDVLESEFVKKTRISLGSCCWSSPSDELQELEEMEDEEGVRWR